MNGKTIMIVSWMGLQQLNGIITPDTTHPYRGKAYHDTRRESYAFLI